MMTREHKGLIKWQHIHQIMDRKKMQNEIDETLRGKYS